MKNNDRYEGSHCCSKMQECLNNWKLPLDYDPERIHYYIPFVYPYRISQGMIYCPWCAKKLPQDESEEELLN
jgi:hypothetical protein